MTIGQHAFYGGSGPAAVTRAKDVGETVFGGTVEGDPGETVFLVAAPRRACLSGFGVVTTARSTPIPTLPTADQGKNANENNDMYCALSTRLRRGWQEAPKAELGRLRRISA